MRQKLRADGSAKSKKNGNGKQTATNAQRRLAVQNSPAHRSAIVAGEPLHQRVLPLFCAVSENDPSQHGSNQDGKQERAQQREGHRPGHRFEEPPFHSLQGENGQIRRDDDAARIEDRPLHLVRGVADLLRRSAQVVLQGQVPDHVLDHHHAAVHHHSKVQRAQ